MDFSFDWNNRYNFWSGLIGGLFIALAYFGTDQSQVQRYLTGASETQSRLGLMFNGLAKVPMQFFILLIGIMVFAFYQFTAPPVFFNPVETERARNGPQGGAFRAVESEYRGCARGEGGGASGGTSPRGNRGTGLPLKRPAGQLLEAEARAGELRSKAIGIMRAADPAVDQNDTNYVFLTFILGNLPVGLIGLLLACVLTASMSSGSGELSALATTTVVDVYRRHIRTDATDGRRFGSRAWRWRDGAPTAYSSPMSRTSSARWSRRSTSWDRSSMARCSGSSLSRSS